MNDKSAAKKTLSAEDQRVIDALLEAGLVDDVQSNENADETADFKRKNAALMLLRKLESYPVAEPDPLLVDSTMARIAREERAARDRMEIHTPSWSKRTQWADFGAVAAVALIATGVTWPIAQRIHSSALEQNCASNLRSMGASLTAYAVDHRGNLPATASLGGLFESPESSKMDWSNYQHSGHLLVLERTGYSKHDACRCPACASGPACGSFAFRVPSSDKPFRIQTMGRTALAADANPVIQMRRLGGVIQIAPSNSLVSTNHQQRGQNVLFADISILWVVNPEINGDNIFLPADVTDAATLPMAPHATIGNDVFLAQ